jgi:hypothetical protein
MLPARAQVESLLRARRLDRTLALPAQTLDDRTVAATGLGALDDRIGGGLPRGHLSEVVGPRSSGRTALAWAAMAAATRRGEFAALVDPYDAFDPALAAAAGIDLARVLWVRGHGRTGLAGAGAQQPGRGALDRALKATNLILQCGNFAMVVLDLADVPSLALRQVPFTTWLRVQRVIEGSQTACLLVAAEPLARSSAGLTLRAAPAAAEWGSDAPRARLLRRLSTDVHILRARYRAADERPVRLTSSMGAAPWP